MIRVEIPGKPVPKARPKVNRIGGVWTPSEEAENAVAAYFLRYRGLYEREPLKIGALFLVNPRQRADADNLLKLVCDAISKAGVWPDDHQVVNKHPLRVTVAYGLEKTVVWLGKAGEPLDEFEAVVREAESGGYNRKEVA